jgi:chromosome segregation ATPase
MTDDYGDTSVDSVEDSQASYAIPTEADIQAHEAGDTDSEQHETEQSEQPEPVPYERFRESREQLSDVRSRNDQLAQQVQGLQEQVGRTNQWNQWQWNQLQQQRQQPQAEVEEYADPLEGEVKGLKAQLNQMQQSQQQTQRYYDHRAKEAEVHTAQREIEAEMSSASQKYPNMDRLQVVNALIQNPNASIDALAKRSQEEIVGRYNTWAKAQGYKPRAKSLQRSSGKASAAKRDFGDDLDAAEKAAIADLDLGDY